tara:strand:- start:417 stop:701 length:285 start_codon:yes stop_codon:yes gene_type:complete
MNFNKDLIEKIANVSRLNLSQTEIKDFSEELKEVVKNFEIIEKAEVKNIQPSFQPIEVKNITREDKIEAPLPQELALSNTKHKKDGYFKGPKAL